MNLFKYLNPYVFLISFCIGMIIIYLNPIQKCIIYKHPTPNNATKIIYRDENDGCFIYNAKEVKCPSDLSIIKKQSKI